MTSPEQLTRTRTCRSLLTFWQHKASMLATCSFSQPCTINEGGIAVPIGYWRGHHLASGRWEVQCQVHVHVKRPFLMLIRNSQWTALKASGTWSFAAKNAERG